MTRERINDFKKIVLPSISKLLFNVNYEGQGKCDAEEFTKDFNEILDLATKALENKPRFLVHSDGKIEQIIEPCDDAVSRQALLEFFKDDDYVVNEINNMPSVLPKCETMQVELEGDGYADGEIVYDSGKCPKCGWKFEDGDKDWEEPFCCHCGQRLNWFNEAESEEGKCTNVQ